MKTSLIFFSYDSTTVLSPVISWGTVILTYTFGIGISFLAEIDNSSTLELSFSGGRYTKIPLMFMT